LGSEKHENGALLPTDEDRDPSCLHGLKITETGQIVGPGNLNRLVILTLILFHSVLIPKPNYVRPKSIELIETRRPTASQQNHGGKFYRKFQTCAARYAPHIVHRTGSQQQQQCRCVGVPALLCRARAFASLPQIAMNSALNAGLPFGSKAAGV
jgi:hypothetical protein